MREVFSFRRFGRLFIKHTVEHFRTYLMSMGVLIGFLILCGLFFFFVVAAFFPDTGFQEASFSLVMLVAGALFTSTVFTDYGDKNKAIPALTLPATTLEKFLVGWLWSYPIFLLVYTGLFYLALWGLGLFRHWNGGQHFIYFSLRDPELKSALVLFTEVHALALFGAIYFRKLQFIRTGFAIFLALTVAIILNTELLRTLTGAAVEKAEIPFTYLNFHKGQKFYQIDIADKETFLVQGVLLASAFSMWIAAYFRLKEKQV
jgi:hypothetical protein